ncbi:MAG: DUF385 domain-containing protein [Gammaproteobacteria bacterium]|nr:DUF385 domain-containing protein [Gammaproteobacteria bacterium]
MAMKKSLQILGGVLLVYVGLVVAFESMLGYFQPGGQETLVITTYNDAGAAHDRVVARLSSNAQLYVAVNHWPRAWYRQARANPEVRVDLGAGPLDYRATLAEGAEAERVNADHPLGAVFRFITGFPPRYFFRLDPQ